MNLMLFLLFSLFLHFDCGIKSVQTELSLFSEWRCI